MNVHPKYGPLEEWKGDDVDMIYQDNHGEFTKKLVQQGHLDKIWSQAKRPKYWLEVKTTTWECGARFFLTDVQHKRV